MKKAIFLDVDGTLVSFNTHKVPRSAVDTLKEVHDAGATIIIATGRAAGDLADLSEIPYDAVIALNGAECVSRDGTLISRYRIPLEDFRKAVELAGQYDIAVAVESDEGIFVNMVTPPVIELADATNHRISSTSDIEKAFVETRCCQICFFCDLETEKKILAELPGLSATRWHPVFADITVKGLSKATGIIEMCRYFGIDIKDTVAIGDGGNDIPMLEIAGTGIAMGNASDEVKACADYVTGTVDEDGILKAIQIWFSPENGFPGAVS